MTQHSLDTIDKAKAAALRLSLTPGIGPKHFNNLVDRFGSPAQVLCASTSDLLDADGVGKKLADAIRSANEIDIQPELERCDKHGLKLLSPLDDGYPQRLREIVDSPVMLYCRGELLPADGMAIGIVGSRHATNYGIQQATRLARGLASAGFTIVSGLARGIDAAAHRGALEANGRTIAVLGSGLLNVYPVEHSEFALDIAEQGAVLSEAATLAAPKKRLLSSSQPNRHRIEFGSHCGRSR